MGGKYKVVAYVELVSGQITIDKNGEASTEVCVPRLGTTVYTLYGDYLTKDTIGFLGKDSFIIEDFVGYESNSIEYKYSDYNVTWFTSLKKAKDALLSKGKQLKKVLDDYHWEVIDK